MSSKKKKNKNSKKTYSITHEYIEYHNKHAKKYGNEYSLVLMQVGSFYEAYSTNDEGPDLFAISDLLDIIKTVKDKKNPTIDISNPHMLGFPIVAIEKFLPILINNNYTIMIIDQVTPPPKPERKITGIYSKGNYLSTSYTSDSNYTICVYIEEIPQKKTKPLLCIGMSAIDLTTGKTIVNEEISHINDNKLALDECNRFITSYNPKEIIIYVNNLKSYKKEFIIDYLELSNKFFHYRDNIEQIKYFLKIKVKTEILSNVYLNKNSMISIIETLNLEKMIYGSTSFVMLIDFYADHEKNIVNNLLEPIIMENNKRVILGNNAACQLNIIKVIYMNLKQRLNR